MPLRRVLLDLGNVLLCSCNHVQNKPFRSPLEPAGEASPPGTSLMALGEIQSLYTPVADPIAGQVLQGCDLRSGQQQPEVAMHSVAHGGQSDIDEWTEGGGVGC